VFYHHTLLPAETNDPALTDLNGTREQAESELDQLRSEEFMAYATGVAAVFKILTVSYLAVSVDFAFLTRSLGNVAQLLDQLHRVTIELCGEVPMKGFQEWREAFERRTGERKV
jgi:hypothetical protein